MKNSIKRTCAVPLLGLSMFMAVPQLTAGQEPAPAAKSLRELGKKDYAWMIPLALVAIPYYQLKRKSPKHIVPVEDEYSLQEIKESTAVLWNYYISNNLKRITFRKTTETLPEEVTKAAEVLWKNIKNLYNMGVVGQLKRDSLLQLYKGKYVQCCQSTPARGIFGHLHDMLGDVTSTAINVGSLYAVCMLFMNISHGVWPFEEPTKIPATIK